MQALPFFRDLVAAQKKGIPRGAASVCSANRFVLEAALLQAGEDGLPVLVESTVNQVNQFGGYTGMRPADFRLLVESAALSVGASRERIILGGDHLGPYPWRLEPAAAAMSKAGDLVAACVRAGYQKVHLDASMPLGGDLVGNGGALDPRTAAEREAALAASAEFAFRELRRDHPDAAPPVYVIGTEVPPPGGIRSSEDPVPVTRTEDFLETVSLCRDAFRRRGLEEAWSRVCAVVAQPGIEYGDREIHEYEPRKAAALCRAARESTDTVLEGHSTDYQKPGALRRLVEDGVAILKVGPALTFALRECLFCLESIERELLAANTGATPSRLAETLEQAMRNDPSHWEGYYVGSEAEKSFARKYSFSDRSRYYWSVPLVHGSVEQLMANLAGTPIPLALLSQFLPLHYRSVREGRMTGEPAALLRESVRLVLRDYSDASTGRSAGR